MNRSPILLTTALLAGLALAGGCCHVKPRSFAFVEAGSGAPIVGATVHMHQAWPEGGPCPADATSYDSGQTDGAGIVTFGIARNAQTLTLKLDWEHASGREPLTVQPRRLTDEPHRFIIPTSRR